MILLLLSLVLVLNGIALKQQFNECSFINIINGKSETNKHQKPNLLFLQRHDKSQTFWLKLVKNRQKTLQRVHYNQTN